MSKKNRIEQPSLLSFERKLETSDGLMYSGNWTDINKEQNNSEKEPLWKEIPISKRYNRSTKSSENTPDTEKPEANLASTGNDDANLYTNNDTLKLSFSLRVIGNVGQPFACNSPNFEDKILSKVTEYKDDENGLKELAFRYAYNIANGRFLWRNRVCAEQVQINAFINKEEKPLDFNAYDFSLKNFSENADNIKLQKLSNYLYSGLKSEDSFVFIKVDAYVQLGNQQHVYPSEEMNTDVKGKTLFKVDECAAMHNVKISNALRTIDNWYGDEEAMIKSGKKVDYISVNELDKTAIAVEPFGAVTQRGIAFRPKNNDLYSKMMAWVNEDEISNNDKNYVVANFIRGGVFSKGG